MVLPRKDAVGSAGARARRDESSSPDSLRGSLAHHVAHDFFSNSSHFPIANLLLEALLLGAAVLREPGVYALLAGGAIQSWFLGKWEFEGRNRRFFGNLIGPAFYTLFEFAYEGGEFFQGLNHLAYWGFSLAIGVFAALAGRFPGVAGELFVILESMARTFIMLAMYWVFEVADKPENASPEVFFGDGSHLFFTLLTVLLGVIVGFERIISRRRMNQVVELSGRLEEYSEWLLGRDLLARALRDPEATLGLRRRERYLLFMDIRGFTAWSEKHSPERVVAMLNRYFSLSEDVWRRCRAVKAKYTGDEVMAVFPSAEQAVQAASEFVAAMRTLLAETGLSVGIGVHCGPLMEGALGSEKVKAYDVIGDTVNTAKRLCDNARPGEVLLSKAMLDAVNDRLAVGEERAVAAKGKKEPLIVYPLLLGTEEGGAS